MAREGGVRLRPRPTSTSTAGAAPAETQRKTRASTKRAAQDDAKSTVLHPRKRAVQPPGRRAPLTDISKQVNAASGSALPGLPELKDLKLKQVIVEGDENALPESSEPLSEPESKTNSSAIASLERSTVKDSKDRVKKGDLFNGRDQDTSSWSNGLEFKDIDTDHSDPQMCSTYAADIYMHLRMAEVG